MIVTAVLAPLLAERISRAGRPAAERCLKILAAVLLFYDPAYWIWEWTTYGRFHPDSTLPLYLCSLFWMLLPVGLFAKPGCLKQTALANTATLGLLSGILGFVFNYHTNVFPFFGFVVLRSLSFHFLLIFGALLLWRSGIYRPQAGDPLRSFLPVLILLIPCLILSTLYGYDYCYTAGGIGTPIELLSQALPKGLYLLVLYAGLFLLIRLLFYRNVPIFPARKEN